MRGAGPYDCFDANQACCPTRAVPQSDVIDLLPVTHAPERIAAYRAAMARGDRFPPVSVLRVGRRYFITDGHKRFAAYRMVTDADVLVELWTVRRWLGDQAGQLARKTRQQLRLLLASRADPAARVALTRLVGDTIGHWRRIGRSLRAHVGPGEPTLIRSSADDADPDRTRRAHSGRLVNPQRIVVAHESEPSAETPSQSHLRHLRNLLFGLGLTQRRGGAERRRDEETTTFGTDG